MSANLVDAGMICTAIFVIGMFIYAGYKSIFTATHCLQGNSSLGNTLPKLDPQGSKKSNRGLAIKLFLLFTFMFFIFNSKLVLTFFVILRYIVLCVHFYTLYKKLTITVQNGCNVVYKEAGVQTEPTTSCENVTSVGSESAFPKIRGSSYDIADEKTYYSYVMTKKFELKINPENKTMGLMNKDTLEVLSVNPDIHPEYLDISYFYLNAF